MRLFNPYSYYPVHLAIVFVFIVLYYLYMTRLHRYDRLANRKNASIYVIIYTFVFMVVVGLRPVHGAFGDTTTIAASYEYFARNPFSIVGTRDSLFYMFQWACSQVMDVEWFFLLCEVLYIVPMVIACSRIFKTNKDIGILFCLSALSFFTYASNGVRNGIATSLVLLAISLLRGGSFEKVLCIALSLVAAYVHKSVSLPIICMFVCYFFKPKKALFYFWILSILVSLVMGNAVADFFANLGFDDRLNRYITTEADEQMFNRTGFRWDFLLYSSIPVIMGYYILFVKKTFNSTYLLLLGTYILSNSFWIMVIRAQYSNRFAYLSWFLYPIVICYPMLKLRIWPKTQGSKAAVVMLGHYAFTLFMYLVFL